ncbi:putative cobalt-precorrin-6Y C(5)-methyltransferase [Clostridium acetireducens DSM 10703]|uniref:Putative cobalt-precorrin-6Y C(5)-methyltransferase n=1 Tax=Clostridium acetireducens DSM 10703 TaxID=1121290 RepID=A0A1E8EZX9_9CLOT|nr:precorrin-6y C5,15-methyltransferase (decarboxylating) subunit CbiE [Clostridium acetireducens]OFI06703.1 putative cobalt-precorrin-6Y C(5)-methyltransferase [Clostridium acetireducens DSM 10703]
MVYIVGIGPGHKDYILPKAAEVLKNSHSIIGFERAISSVDFIENNKIKVKKLSEILDIINNAENKDISIIASGDPLFYGITNYINKNYKGKVEIVPGISSFQYMMAKINIPWNEGFLGSLHGREEDFLNKVKEHKVSIWLTDKKHSPSYICDILEKENIEATIYVGENLSYEDERITKGTIKELKNKDFSALTVVVIKKL